MKYKVKAPVIMLILLLSVSAIYCVINDIFSHRIPVYRIKNTPDNFEVVFDELFMAGPFQSDSNADAIYRALNIQKVHIDNKDIRKLKRLRKMNKPEKRYTCKLITEGSGYFDIPFHLNSIENTDGNPIYLQAKLRTGKPQVLYLALWGCNDYNIWINDSLVLETEVTKHHEVYKVIKPVKLRKGINHISVRLNNRLLKMALLSRSKASQELMYTTRVYQSLHDPVIDNPGGNLFMKDAILEFGIHNISIQDFNGRKYASGIKPDKLKSDKGLGLDFLPFNQLYKLCFNIDSLSCQEYFFFGDICLAYPEYEKKAKKMFASQEVKINLETLLFRYRELVKRYRDNMELSLEIKMVMMATELEKYFQQIQTKQLPFSNLGGFNLRGYVSGIDSQVRHYYTLAPDTIDPDKKFKLVVRINPFTDKHHFLTGGNLSNFPEYITAQRMAQEYGFIILIASQRLYKKERHMPPLAEAETFNCIRDVKKYYTIDEDNIILSATCAGANRAMLFAQDYPDYFAGLALHGIAYHKGQTPESYDALNRISNLNNLHVYAEGDIMDDHAPYLAAKPVFDRFKETNLNFRQSINHYNRWFYGHFMTDNFALEISKWEKIQEPESVYLKSWKRHTDGTGWLQNIVMGNEKQYFSIQGKIEKNTIRLTGENVVSFSINTSETILQNNQKKITLLYNGKKHSIERKYGEDILNFEVLPTIDRNQFPFSKNKQTEGPVWEVFANPFLFVRGSIGPTAHASTCDSMVYQWNRYFYSNVNSVPDTIPEQQKASFNLVLFGNEHTNKVIRDISDLLPVRCYPDSLCFGTKVYPGNNISYQFCYPNPYNPEKYLLVVGSNNANEFTMYQQMPWYEGISDFTIWTTGKNKNILVLEDGKFNREWVFSDSLK